MHGMHSKIGSMMTISSVKLEGQILSRQKDAEYSGKVVGLPLEMA